MRHITTRRAVLPVLALGLAAAPTLGVTATASSVSGATGAPSQNVAPERLRVPEAEVKSAAEGTYVVTMAAEPLIAYDGGTAGLPATKPRPGAKVAPAAADVRSYQSFLRARHAGVLRDAGVPAGAKFYDYTVALNGFAARLTPAQASRLETQPGVVAVSPDLRRQVDTISTPRFLGLTGPGGTWARGVRGEGVVIGVVDSGIWPDNPSFSDRRNGERVYGAPRDWFGACDTGDAFTAEDCNNKLIGARFFGDGFGGEAAVKASWPYEYWSPRDADGHGSHTAGTAAGNWRVPVVVDGQAYGSASGMAHRARLAAYKVCWGRAGDGGGCTTSDSVAAIDQAVLDGVDVINFSISGTSSRFVDPVELAFLNAANAGVFVTASGGNDGPGAGTVNHPSPWITTVAASTHDRLSEATLTLGNGVTHLGSSIQTTGTDTLPLVYAGDIPAVGRTAADAALCFPGSLDATDAAGRMVVCDRGVNARNEKSKVVRDAGGLAMVLVNTSPNSVNADLHFVPSIHLDSVVRADLLAYARTDGATAALSPGRTVRDRTAPVVAAFSSRGPSDSGGDILKPDITAPGVDVLAAVSPDVDGRDFDLLSGTSMSSPHMAGLGALVKSEHPDWSPARIKSALMTTAYDVTGATPLDVGSGHVDVDRALEAVLSYDVSDREYLAFLCGTGQVAPTPLCRESIDGSELNQPNISIGSLAGRQTVTRTVTNLGRAASFRAEVAAPAGVEVTVSPSSMRLAPGARATFEVTFTAGPDAVFDDYTFGTLDWVRGDGQRVNSDLAVRPVALSAPDAVAGEGVSGAGEFDVTFGYTGSYTAAAHGLEAGRQTADTVVDDPANDINVAIETGVGITVHALDVPAGSVLARFSLFDDYTDGADDLDLYLFDSEGDFVSGSASGTSAEQVDLSAPAAGTYFVVVHGWETDGPDAAYTLFDWSVPADPTADDGSLVVDSAPAAATVGETGTVGYSWSGLADGQKYLGAVSHSGPEGLVGATLVEVDTD